MAVDVDSVGNVIEWMSSVALAAPDGSVAGSAVVPESDFSHATVPELVFPRPGVWTCVARGTVEGRDENLDTAVFTTPWSGPLTIEVRSDFRRRTGTISRPRSKRPRFTFKAEWPDAAKGGRGSVTLFRVAGCKGTTARRDAACPRGGAAGRRRAERRRVARHSDLRARWGPLGEIAGRREAEFRMLAVSPGAQGRGVGTALLRRVLDDSRRRGKDGVVCSSLPEMRAAHRIYQRLGFQRAPERDWSPVPGVELLAFAISLPAQPA